MGKNKLGKFIAFTTAITAIGGACYIYRDKIKESEIFKAVTGKIADWMDKDGEPNDFIFDEDDDFDDVSPFDEEAKKNREYTSINITSTSSEESETPQDDSQQEASITDNITQGDITTDDTTDADTENVITADTVSDNISEDDSTKEDNSKTGEFDDIIINPSFSSSSSESPDTFEYEGLSDVSEDPDVLEDQDKLDF